MGVKLIVLTADPEARLNLGINKHQLPKDLLYRVEPGVWADLQIANPQRPEIPVPTTWVIGPQGTIIYSEQTGAKSDRVSATAILSTIRQHQSDNAEPLVGPPTPDRSGMQPSKP